MSSEPLYYFTEGEIYGRCPHKHLTKEEATQCRQEYKTRKYGDQEFRLVYPAFGAKNNPWLESSLLGFGQYEIEGSGKNSILFARSLFLDGIHSLRLHVLKELQDNCFPTFKELHPDIHIILRKITETELTRQRFLRKYSQEELENEFKQHKDHYQYPQENVLVSNNEPTKTSDPTDSIFNRHSPEHVDDTLYYWDNLELAATIYYKNDANLISLYHSIKNWSVKWNLTKIGKWCLDQAIQTLILWCQSDKAKEKLYWKGYSYPYPNVFTSEEIFFSFENEGWNPLKMTEKNFRTKIAKQFTQHLDKYIQQLHNMSKQHGLRKIPILLEPRHFDWLVKNKIPDLEYKQQLNVTVAKVPLSLREIAKSENINYTTISKGVNNALVLLGLVKDRQ